MIFFTNLWRFWTDSWSSAKRARLLYVAFALGFLGLAIGGIVKGDATVIVLGALFALAATALAVIAPKLSNITNRDVGTEP
jgi:hypothetical protein